MQLKLLELSKRVLDVATSHYHHISVAMTKDNRIYMWGQCLGQKIETPMLTPLKSMYYVFAFYASPTIMHQPLIFHSNEETNLTDSLRDAFDDPVSILYKD